MPVQILRAGIDVSALVAILTTAGRQYRVDTYEKFFFSPARSVPKGKPSDERELAVNCMLGRDSWIMVEKDTGNVTIVPDKDVAEYYFDKAPA